MVNPFAILVDMLFDFYVYIILARFFMQYFRTDFYNPAAQFVVKATNPLLMPLRRLIPGVGGIDLASLLLVTLFCLLKIVLLSVILYGAASLAQIGAIRIIIGSLLYLPLGQWPIDGLLFNIFDLFFFLVIVRAIMSWLNPGGYNPMVAIIFQITEPLLAPFRRILPPLGAFDFSPMLLLLLLWFVPSLIQYYLSGLFYS